MMKFLLNLDRILVAVLLPSWISWHVEARSTTSTQSRRLRGKPIVRARNLYEHEPEYNNERTIRLQHSRKSIEQGQNGKELDPMSDLDEAHNFREHENRIESYDKGEVDTELIDEQKETIEEARYKGTRRHDKKLHVLPAGNFGRDFNSSLYNDLHNAPFEIYESAFGIGEEEREKSFPVFVVPDWQKDTTGVFSAFSRTASPLTFQNMQILLTWEDVKEASTGADEELAYFINSNNFEASLFIGKTLGDSTSDIPFLGLVASYHQHSQKNILVPFAKIEHFFHDTSEKHLLRESAHYIDHDTLHEILDAERSNNSTSTFFHPELIAETLQKNRREQLEDVEAIHFRRLFQLLIRRTFLFSYGYADCLKEEPHDLRSCLDDTFSLVVQMEAAIRDALDDQLFEELERITQVANTSKYREACVSLNMYGIMECSVSLLGNVRGLGGTGAFTTLSSTFR